MQIEGWLPRFADFFKKEELDYFNMQFKVPFAVQLILPNFALQVQIFYN